MDKLKYILSILCVTGLMTACSQDELTDGTLSEGEKYPLVLTASIGASTRSSVDGTWQGGEPVYVQIKGDYTEGEPIDWTGIDPILCTISTDDKKTIVFPSGEEVYWKHGDGPKFIRAWYSGKREEYVSGDFQDVTIKDINNSALWVVSSSQDYGTNYVTSDFVLAQQSASPSNDPVELTFYHQVAKVLVNIRNTDFEPSMTFKYLYFNNVYRQGMFSAPKENEIYGSWVTSGNDGQLYLKPLATPNSADFGEGTETAKASYECIVIPQSLRTDAYLLIRPKDDYDSFGWNLAKNNTVIWEAGKVYTYNVTITPAGLKLSSISVNTSWDSTGATGSGEVVL